MSPDNIKATNEATHARIDRAADKTKKGAADTVRRVQDKLDAAADRTEEGVQNTADAAARGAHKVADKASEWRDRGTDLARQTRDNADRAIDSVRAFVGDRPIESVVVALAAGWLLRRLLQSRR